MSGKSCLEQNQDEQFVSIKLYNIGKNPADSKPSNIYIGSHFMCDIKDSYEGKEPIESPFNIEKVTIKDEYYISKTEQINNVYETKEIKTEYEMGVINKEVKSEIGDEENDRELMANAQEIISRSPTTVFPSYSKTWLQREPPGREESETDLEDGKTDQGGENANDPKNFKTIFSH
ncbi:hypothetical protein JTB14_023795 [Gonioctena quinquepunctata]|nr:hypothetical protein JTB14_023795 [Gonioctena quinquepunctata]